MLKNTIISAYIAGLTGILSTALALSNGLDLSAGLSKRQYYGGMEGGLPGVEGMNTRYASPFAAFWNQGLVPGQGLPQIGMSAYGYGLPGLGLAQFLNPDVQILKGVGEGEITENDVKHLENNVNGYDRFKEPSNDNVHQRPDPAFPGHFKNEDDDDKHDEERHDGHYRHKHDDYNSANMLVAQPNSVSAATAAAALCAVAMALF
ncbi:hypothetical protein J3B02_003577 [Coemansia erecta]|nr:hypothetical protein J3B02_003577 [Coemansia erecta]KAJ2887615.1 hypothetical protein FB639_001183 [Coemansia asiatica]